MKLDSVSENGNDIVTAQWAMLNVDYGAIKSILNSAAWVTHFRSIIILLSNSETTMVSYITQA